MVGVKLARDCASLLAEYARDEAFAASEIRQAAIWGLGKDGLRDYGHLLEFLDATSDEERVHAVCAFSSDASVQTVDDLTAI